MRKLLKSFPLLLAAALPQASAIDGGKDVYITVPTGNNIGWKTFEIISGNDALGDRAKEGFVWTAQHARWDGLGAYRHDSDTLRVFINHESGANSTFSRVDVDLSNLRAWIAGGIANNTNSNQVDPSGPIVTAVSRGWLSVGSGTNPITTPCSANVWMADTFGPGRGFADTIYLTGEETFNASGNFWAMDVATRIIYECPDLGGGSWENACVVDTGRTDTVALLLGEDAGASATGTAPLRLYVGLKNPNGDFLQRNGLSGGTVYYWDPAGASTNGTPAGIFVGGNGTVVGGTWVTTKTNAALFSKLEDVHTDTRPASPGYGVEVAFASQDQAVFTVDLSQVDFEAGALGVAREAEVELLFQAGSQAGANVFGGMDNLVWSADGCIYVTEDDSEGDVWRIDVASLRASYAALDFTPDATQVYDILDADFVSESSGIIDISAHVGYEPGGVFLISGQSGTLATNQLAMAVAPGATVSTYTLAYAAGLGGSVTGNAAQVVAFGNNGTAVTATPASGYGFLGWSDGVLTAARTDTNVMAALAVTANFEVTSAYLVWISGYPSLSVADAEPGADPDKDGVINQLEFAANLDPTIGNPKVLAAGTGTEGLPLIEVRTFGGERRLVIEYLRRTGDPDLTYTPQFNPGLLPPGWAAGGNETVSPINNFWERVVREDSVNISGAEMRFARLRVDLTVP